jgi:tRNA A-37 threonylcarbamoyl transferase component Bud32
MEQKLSKYKIFERIGEGATAEVYHAQDTVLGREVALKILKPALVPDPSAFARFVQEAQSAARLFHNNIATVLDMGDADGRYFIALRYIPGRSLDKILQADGPLPWDAVLQMSEQIGAALDYAHEEGFLHRDVKPSNIIRDEKGDFILTDFGLTRAMMSTGLTSHTGAVLGTPSYIAPEIWNGQPASQASDQYALACVIFETITGEGLFQGPTPQAIITNHLVKQPQFPQTWPPDSPNRIEAVLEKALLKEPRNRYRNVALFTKNLQVDGNDTDNLGIFSPHLKIPAKDNPNVPNLEPGKTHQILEVSNQPFHIFLFCFLIILGWVFGWEIGSTIGNALGFRGYIGEMVLLAIKGALVGTFGFFILVFYFRKYFSRSISNGVTSLVFRWFLSSLTGGALGVAIGLVVSNFGIISDVEIVLSFSGLIGWNVFGTIGICWNNTFTNNDRSPFGGKPINKLFLGSSFSWLIGMVVGGFIQFEYGGGKFFMIISSPGGLVGGLVSAIILGSIISLQLPKKQLQSKQY